MPLWRADPSTRRVKRGMYVPVSVISPNNNTGHLYNEYVEEDGLKETLRKRRILVSLYLWAEIQGVKYFVTAVTTWHSQLAQWKTRPCWQKCGVSLVFVIVVRPCWVWLRSVLTVWLNWHVSESPRLSPLTINTTRLNAFGLNLWRRNYYFFFFNFSTFCI